MHDIIKPYDEIYNNYIKMIEKEKITDIFSIRVKESFYKSVALTEFIKTDKCDLKVLLFQIIHTLAILQKTYSGFRHNMLTL